MTPETISALVNMGSAGAVIAVVIIFLKSIRERDAEWRAFFTALNSNNKVDVERLATLMEKMFNELTNHDTQARRIADDVVEVKSRLTDAVTRMEERTSGAPRRTQPRKQ